MYEGLNDSFLFLERHTFLFGKTEAMQMLLDQSDSTTLCNLGFNFIDKNLERYSELLFLFLSSYAQFCHNRHWKALSLPLSPKNYSKNTYFKCISCILSRVFLLSGCIYSYIQNQLVWTTLAI